LPDRIHRAQLAQVPAVRLAQPEGLNLAAAVRDGAAPKPGHPNLPPFATQSSRIVAMAALWAIPCFLAKASTFETQRGDNRRPENFTVPGMRFRYCLIGFSLPVVSNCRWWV
jgi:hypothetical protein